VPFERGISMHWLGLDRQASSPLVKQLYRQLRYAILERRLAEDERLPSSRELAKELGISRNVVTEVYEQLVAEGYLVSRIGSGTYVSGGASYRLELGESRRKKPGLESEPREGLIDFRTGVPFLEKTPRKLMVEAFRCAVADCAFKDFGYGQPQGLAALREEISRFLLRSRDIACDPGQVVVTNGAAEALFLAAHVVRKTRSLTVLTEDPVHLHFQQTFSLAGARLEPVGVDLQGMKTKELPEEILPDAIFTTPSHQFPMGGILPIQRRIELLEYAKRKNAYVIEDDYESEFRFEGAPVSSLRELAPSRVIYVGSFSKILVPSIRVGYAILPNQFVDPFCRLKYDVTNHVSGIDQAALAKMLESGRLERHIAGMKRIYRVNRKTLLKALSRSFPNECEIASASSGLHLVARFPGRVFDKDSLQNLEKSGVRVYPVETHAIRKGNYLDSLILGYGNLSPHEIEMGITRLKQGMQSGRNNGRG
jgi:GntR family transcriptional regulator/MocR family aminotransferase